VGAGVLKKAQNSGMITVADTTTLMPGDSMEDIRSALSYLDYFVPSYAEASALSGKNDLPGIAGVFLALGVKNVVIKLGAQGCFINAGLAGKMVKGYNVSHVVDTTGCGDNFVAGFIAGLIKGFSLEECAQLANAAGAINAMQLGSNGAVKSFDQLIRFRDGNNY
jgi:sugar/nucleoside kinase (ribokinase family)